MELRDKLLKQITRIEKDKSDVAKFVTLNFKNGSSIVVKKGFSDNFYYVSFYGKANYESIKSTTLSRALSQVYVLIHEYCYKECEHDWDEIIQCRSYKCKKCGEVKQGIDYENI